MKKSTRSIVACSMWLLALLVGVTWVVMKPVSEISDKFVVFSALLVTGWCITRGWTKDSEAFRVTETILMIAATICAMTVVAMPVIAAVPVWLVKLALFASMAVAARIVVDMALMAITYRRRMANVTRNVLKFDRPVLMVYHS